MEKSATKTNIYSHHYTTHWLREGLSSPPWRTGQMASVMRPAGPQNYDMSHLLSKPMATTCWISTKHQNPELPTEIPRKQPKSVPPIQPTDQWLHLQATAKTKQTHNTETNQQNGAQIPFHQRQTTPDSKIRCLQNCFPLARCTQAKLATTAPPETQNMADTP